MEIAFADQAAMDAGLAQAAEGGTYVRQLATRAACDDEADPSRAMRMHLPPIEVSVTAASPEGQVHETRLVSPAHLHRAMPRGGLGTRLLQMFSATCRQGYSPAAAGAAELDAEAADRHDVRGGGLARELDLSCEPDATHAAIASAVNAFFEDPARRVAFLTEFNSKFPGVLTDERVLLAAAGQRAPATAAAALRARAGAEFAVAVYLTIDFSVPDPAAPGGARANKLHDVPIVFRLR
jgi:hypothetical protein